MTNKRKFKDFCKKHGVEVVPEYSLSDIENDKVTYPILVKPTDNRGSIGQTVCFKKEDVKKPQPPTGGGSKDLGYATFKGSWPNAVNGRMIFKSSHVLDSKDPKGRVAEAGDYVIGEWADGHLVQGIWYGADNQVKGSIIIGK